MAQESFFWNGSTYKETQRLWAWNGSAWKEALGMWVWDGSTWKKCFQGTFTVFGVTHFVEQESTSCGVPFIISISYSISPATFDNTTYRVALWNDISESQLAADIYDGSGFYEYNTGIQKPLASGSSSETFGNYSVRIIRRSDSALISSSSTATSPIVYTNLGEAC